MSGAVEIVPNWTSASAQRGLLFGRFGIGQGYDQRHDPGFAAGAKRGDDRGMLIGGRAGESLDQAHQSRGIVGESLGRIEGGIAELARLGGQGRLAVSRNRTAEPSSSTSAAAALSSSFVLASFCTNGFAKAG